ncbi:MAG TPA: hypothetical protein VFP61_06630 [Acidimicrobiales bacterium]|nr:hypothetical protein [Acidimicrobiales bacterium]
MSSQPTSSPHLRAASRMARQHGCLTLEQARACGLSYGAVRAAVAGRRWGRPLPGVLVDRAAVATPTQSLLVAVLWAGEGAVSCRLSAAWLWALLDRAPARRAVATPADRRSRSDIDVVRLSTPAPRVLRQGVPCTTLERTLCDCATTVGDRLLESLLDRAVGGRRGLATRLARRLGAGGDLHGRPGAARLRRALAAGGYGGSPQSSDLESPMARAFADAGVTGLVREHPVDVDGRRCFFDFARPDLRLAWEGQSVEHHSSPEALRRDARKANAASRDGWTVRYYTWFDLTHDRARVVAEMAADVAAAEARPQ